MQKEQTKTVAKLVGATSSRPNFEGKTKKQKGITLIALIITIIVMLILVGVTVSVSLNGGLFSTAKQATSDTEAEREKEETLSSGRVEIGGVWYDSMDDYVNKIPSKNQEDTTEESPELGLLRTYFLGERDETTGTRPGKNITTLIISPTSIEEILTADPGDIVFADDEENTGILSEDLSVVDFDANEGVACIKYNNTLYELTISAQLNTLKLNKAITGTIISDTDTTNPSQIEIQFSVANGKITFTPFIKGKMNLEEYIDSVNQKFSTEELENLCVQLAYGYDTVDNYAAAMAEENGTTADEEKVNWQNLITQEARNEGMEYKYFLSYATSSMYFRFYQHNYDLIELTGDEHIEKCIEKYIEENDIEDTEENRVEIRDELVANAESFGKDPEAAKKYYTLFALGWAIGEYGLGDNAMGSADFIRKISINGVVVDPYNYWGYVDRSSFRLGRFIRV